MSPILARQPEVRLLRGFPTEHVQLHGTPLDAAAAAFKAHVPGVSWIDARSHAMALVTYNRPDRTLIEADVIEAWKKAEADLLAGVDLDEVQ